MFCIWRKDLEEVFQREERIKGLFDAAMEWRAAEAKARVLESRRIFEGV